MPDFAIPESVAARLEKLERESRRLRRISLFTSLALVAVTAMGAAAGSGALTARSLTIVDSSGHARVKLDTTGVSVLDSRGKLRVSATINSYNQPAFRLSDKNGVVRLRAYLSANDEPNLKFEDAKNVDRMWAGPGSLSYYDSGGTERTAVGLSDTQAPLVEVYDSSHKSRGFLGQYTDASFGLFIKDSAGTTTWSAP